MKLQSPSLTPAQREAVEHVEGPLLILAGPGSGKTRVVTHRVAHLLHVGVPARDILALTFTNKAADEMRGRIEQLAPGRPVWVSTFHRFCSRLLREHASLVGLEANFTIYDTADSRSVLKRALQELDFDPGRFTPQQIGAAISWAKNSLVGAADYQARPGNPLGGVVAKVFPKYQELLLRANAVDFDDLLLHVARLVHDNEPLRAALDARYSYILVDEYQDTNLAQYAIVRALSFDAPNLAVTGDPDQSIYGWRGANLGNILEFERDFPEVRIVRLEQNYRSTQRILSAAAHLIEHNVRRKRKGLFTENERGRPVRMSAYPNQRDEADTIAQRIAAAVRRGDRRLRDFAVFYRVNALSRALEFSFREAGVPYQLVRGLEFYQRKEIKDVLGYLTLLNNPRDDTAFLRVVNMPLRGIGKASLERLAWHAARFGGSLFEAAREVQLIEDMPKRSAKRLQEFVVLIDELTARGAHTIEELIGHVLSRTGYREHLEASKQAEDQERLANVEELLTAARQFDERGGESGGLEAFLEESSLVNDVDDWSETDDRVALMSLHASKGLEFPVVFIMAVEEKILPHEQSAKNLDQLEEERRLLFVGMTRAREELYLSLARQRDFRGSRRMTVPSSFLFELPLEELEVDGLPSADGYEANDDQSSHEEPVYQAHAGGTHAEDGPGDEPHGVEFDPAAFVASRDTSAESPPAAASMPRLTTAAEMAGESTYRDDAPPVPAESFRHGMVVLHPDYGLGTVLALSGSGERRVATVEFAGYGEKKFVLAHSPLRPVKRRS